MPDDNNETRRVSFKVWKPPRRAQEFRKMIKKKASRMDLIPL